MMSDLAVVDLETFLTLVLSDLRLDINFKVNSLVTKNGPQLQAEFSGADAGRLTADNGALLLALEHLAAMKFRMQPGQYHALNFDACGFKAERERKVTAEAKRVIQKAIARGLTHVCQPMSYRERFMLHEALAGYGLRSQLVTEGKERRLVIHAGHRSEAASGQHLAAAV
jgi:spoIIIJ-associated protein